MPLSRRSLGCLLFLAACGDDASESIDAGAKPPADAAADRVPDGNGTPLDGGSPNELNCVGVFDCVTVCAEGDDACVEACLASASEASLALVNAVLTCAEQLGCTEEDCLALSCEPELLACAGTAAPDAGVDDAAAAGCDGAGIPEMTGPVSGLETSYAAGALIEVGVAVDEDTARVIVGIYEVGSSLYLGGTAEEVAPSSTSTLRFYAGVADGRTGSFYLSIELCSTSLCTPPFVRNTYQRRDRNALLESGEAYVQTRQNVGGQAMTETCESTIPLQSFQIE